MAKLNWEIVREIRARAQDGAPQIELVAAFNISQPLCSQIVRRRRAFLGLEAFVFGEATSGEYAKGFRSAWETLLLLANGIEPVRHVRGQRPSNRQALARINLHWHDLRHEALSRLGDDGVPVHELQLLAGHASITTTQRYMNARANSLAESMRKARERRSNRMNRNDDHSVQVG
jgi:hypothetical protein